MADDTRESPINVSTSSRPREPANMMPGGMANTAGGKSADAELPTFENAVKTIRLEEFKTLHQKPCARDGLLTGIAAGFGIGGIGAVLRKPVWTFSSYAVFGFCTFSLGSYQYCQYQRKKEKEGMRRVVEVIEKKKNDLAAKKEARRKAKEEADRLEEERRQEEAKMKSWSYWAQRNLKFW